MLFTPDPGPTPLYIARTDVAEPLAAYAKFGFKLDGAQWPSVEHYYQAMLFEDASYREQIRLAEHPKLATKLGKAWFKPRRKDWKKLRPVIMTRAVYTKCRTHPEITEKLLATGDQPIVDNTQYDYYWGCGRDKRGENHFGKVLMEVRKKLREEEREAADERLKT